MSRLPVMLFIAAVLVGSFVILTVPTANALTKKECYTGYTACYSNPTARLGNTAVCGDHMCAPGEWDKLISALTAAQRSQQAGWTAKSTATTPANSPATTSNATAPTYPPAPSTPSAGASATTCNSILNLLNGAGVSDKVTTQVMTDLGCSYK